MVVAKLTVDHTDYRTEHHSLSELYIEDIEIVVVPKHLIHHFFIGKSLLSFNDPAASKALEILLLVSLRSPNQFIQQYGNERA